MACFSGMFHSAVLGRELRLCAVLPQDDGLFAAEPKKTLVLLHGLGDTNEAWLSKSLVLRLAEKRGIAVLMPDIGSSFCCDSFAGEKWFTCLAEELPQAVKRMFRLSEKAEDWLIAGQSMGGYGALRLALCCPQQYGAAGVFSPAWDLQRLLFKGDSVPIAKETAARLRQSIFGSAAELPEEADIRRLLAGSAGKKLPIYLSMGREDPLRESCDTLRKLLREAGYCFTYEEFDGGHEWPVWHPSLEHFLRSVLPAEGAPALCAARDVLVRETAGADGAEAEEKA